MINSHMIDSVKSKLIDTYDPYAIYIFGSYAWETPNEDSDLDVLIKSSHFYTTYIQV